jgi:hypothetical protein
MSEWWTYRLSDFLLFSARTYHRLVELYNADVWPAHLVGLGVGFALLFVPVAGAAWASRAACVLLALCWAWVAWAFHLQRYLSINWAASWFAAAFALEGALLVALCGFGPRLRMRAVRGWRGGFGVGLLVFALVVQPLIGRLLGRPWSQVEVFGMAPDPTALGTLGLLLLLGAPGQASGAWRSRLSPVALWPIPVLWSLVSGATLSAMQAPDALLMPLAALLAASAAFLTDPRDRRR